VLNRFSVGQYEKIKFAGSVEVYFQIRTRDRAGYIGDKTMEIAEQSRIETVKSAIRNHDATTLFGYSIFAIVLLIAIYFGSMSSGIAPGDLASTTVFP
jgi:hypothetical protein